MYDVLSRAGEEVFKHYTTKKTKFAKKSGPTSIVLKQ